MTRCTRHTTNNSRHKRFRIHAAYLEYGVTLASYSASRSLQTPFARSIGEMSLTTKAFCLLIGICMVLPSVHEALTELAKAAVNQEARQAAE